MRNTDPIIEKIHDVLDILKSNDFTTVEFYRQYKTKNSYSINMLVQSAKKYSEEVFSMEAIVRAVQAERELKTLLGYSVMLFLKEETIFPTPLSKSDSVRLSIGGELPPHFSDNMLLIFNAPIEKVRAPDVAGIEDPTEIKIGISFF